MWAATLEIWEIPGVRDSEGGGMGVRRLLRRLTRAASRLPLLGRLLFAFHERRAKGLAWLRVHPFDRAYGLDTSGFVPGMLLADGATAYGAAQPSIVRRALAAIPEPRSCRFVDVGCGKGRPLFVAAEAGFSAITGVEFTPALARIAKRNAAIFARRRPDLPRIEIVTANVLHYPLPLEPLAIFLYNPFDRELTERLVHAIEATLVAAPRDLYVISMNPAWADVFDASSALERRYAAQLAYDATEIGFGPDPSDAVVVWQNRGNRHPRPDGNPDARVTIVVPGMRAVVDGG